jgi:hypothetical protein
MPQHHVFLLATDAVLRIVLRTSVCFCAGHDFLWPACIPPCCWREPCNPLPSSLPPAQQALATGNVLAAAALQLQGASVLAGLRALLVLNGPGGAGIQDATVAAALSTAAAAAASGSSMIAAAATATGSTASGGADAAATAAAAAAAAGRGMSAAALTGSSVHCDDVAAGWVQLVQLVLELQGVVGARQVLALAEAHFPREAPLQLAAMRQVGHSECDGAYLSDAGCS